jgi:alpha-L-fucosidase
MGEWLSVNGEAIYGTRTWKVHAEGSTEKLITNNGRHTGWRFDQCGSEDIRFTRKGDAVYAIALGWPQTGSWLVKSLGGAKVKSVSMLGGKPVKWSLGAEGLRIEAPSTQSGKYAYTFKIAM